MTEGGRAKRKAVGGLGRRTLVLIHWKILTLVLGVVFAFVALGITQVPAAAADERGAYSPDFAAIDHYIEEEMEATRLPGLALAIVRNDRIVHMKGFGESSSSGRKVTPQTPFVIGSTGKSFTALAIMQMVEEGKIDLDAPVKRYITWFEVADEEVSSRITLRHLLIHTSGLPTAADRGYVVREDPSYGALEKEVRALEDVELSRPVGSSFEYSNMNYTILGLTVQTVSGEPYERYVEERIFAPLDMNHSFANHEEAKENGLTQGYRYWFGIPRPTDLIYNRAALPAGLHSASAEDMAHHLIAQLNGGRYGGEAVLSPEGIAEMHRGAVRGTVMDGTEFSYGMGWSETEINGIPAISHSGGTPVSSSDMILVPKDRWGVMVLTNAANYSSPRIGEIGDGVVSLLKGREVPPPSGPGQMLIGSFALVGILVLQILGIVRSVVLTRRWRSRPEAAPRGVTQMALRVWALLTVNLLWAFASLIVAPSLLAPGVPFSGLLLMDFGQMLVASGAVALIWGILTLVLVSRTLRQTGAARLVSRKETEVSPVNA